MDTKDWSAQPIGVYDVPLRVDKDSEPFNSKTDAIFCITIELYYIHTLYLKH